jgi:hypothetical protein
MPAEPTRPGHDVRPRRAQLAVGAGGRPERARRAAAAAARSSSPSSARDLVGDRPDARARLVVDRGSWNERCSA